jgi:hypothetical protein
MNKQKINRLCGVFLGVIFLIVGILIPFQVDDRAVPRDSPFAVYPQFFPAVIAIFGCLLSVILTLRNSIGVETIDIPTTTNLWRVLIIVAMILFYILAFYLFGYILSTVIGLILFMSFLGLRDVKYFALLIAVFPIVVYYLFSKLLSVPFPRGIFDF